MKQKKLSLLAFALLCIAGLSSPLIAQSAALKGLHYLAEKGDAASQRAIGIKYLYGDGVQKDDTKAFEFLQKAASQEDLEGIIYLGKLCREGQGTKQDPEQAALLFQKAAQLGDPVGQVCLGELYLEGAGVPKSEKDAFAYFLKSARQGQPIAQSYVASLYGEGREVPQNLIEAYAWGIVAEAQGETDWKSESLLSSLSEEDMKIARRRAEELVKTIYTEDTLETLSTKS